MSKKYPINTQESAQESIQEEIPKLSLDVLELVRDNENITRDELALQLNVSPSAIKNTLLNCVDLATSNTLAQPKAAIGGF